MKNFVEKQLDLITQSFDFNQEKTQLKAKLKTL